MLGSIEFIIATAGLAGITAGASFALRRLWNLSDGTQTSAERLPDLSVRTYAPIERLFSSRDIAFLREQPGFNREMEFSFRAKRAEAFRLYVRSMRRDYRTLHGVARAMAAQGIGSTDLSARLVEMQWAFQQVLIKAQFQAFLYERGWAEPVVSLQPLVESMLAVRSAMNAMPLAAR